jgi:hypothetical protein
LKILTRNLKVRKRLDKKKNTKDKKTKIKKNNVIGKKQRRSKLERI